MSQLLSTRNILWALALGLTVWLSVNAPPKQDNIVHAKRAATQASEVSVSTPTADSASVFALTPRHDAVTVEANLFAIAPVAEIRRVSPIRKQSMKPLAPPIPFKYLGSVVKNKERKFFVSLGEEMIVVKVGETIDDRYKLVSVEKMGNQSTLKFLYLPMKLTQTMVVNNAN